jgi:phosphoesterase RecJ-like protein
MNNSHPNELRKAFSEARSVLVFSHVRPDGDAIGSMLGLGLSLLKAGKEVQMVLTDGVPRNFRFLRGSEQTIKHAQKRSDLIVVLDCSDLSRVGDVIQGMNPDINIDHHITNINFGRMNFVMPDAVATSAILSEFLPTWGLGIDEDIAAALLTGLVSDTLGFRTSNMNAHALGLAATLAEYGASLPEVYEHALINRSFEAVSYWGQGLIHIQRQGRLVWTVLKLEDRLKANYPGNDDADLINILSGISDADISIIFVEQHGGRVKVSWRAQSGLDVARVAFKFGGGGHTAAAGAEISGNLEDVQAAVLAATTPILNQSSTSSKIIDTVLEETVTSNNSTGVS